MAILFDKTATGTHPTGKTAGTFFKVGPFKRKTALVMASAHGTAHYSGPTANAGIQLTLQAGSGTVRTDSFEAQSANLDFNVAASSFVVLNAGDTTIIAGSVLPLGAGGEARNRGTMVHLHVVALDANAAVGPTVDVTGTAATTGNTTTTAVIL